MITENIPIGLSAVVLGLGYFNIAFSLQEFINKRNQPIWKKLWRCVQGDVEDLCRVLLLAWALFPNIWSMQSLRILWIMLLTESLYRRLRSKMSFIQGGFEDVCRILLMWLALYSNISSLHDIWVVWIIALMEFIYRRIRLKIPYFKEFAQRVCSSLPGRRQLLSHGKTEAAENETDKKILSELKCPMCTKVMAPPITMCENGHNVCKNCKPKLDKCPICRGALLELRNVALENVAQTFEVKT